MRYVYLDEAGVSARERFVTVAGIVVHADKHLRAISDHLDKIRASLPSELGADLVFHAKDLWHGVKDFDRARWEGMGICKDRRRALLDSICSITEEMNLPVVHGLVDKEQHFSNWQILLKSANFPKHWNPNRLSYGVAFGSCAVEAEAFLRDWCPNDEVGHIVAEDTREMREHAKFAYSLLEKKNAPWSNRFTKYIPLERLAEEPHFTARKSPALQVADSIAFVLARHYSRGVESDVAGAYKRLRDQFPMVKHWGEFGAF